MSTHQHLLDHIQSLVIVDTHEHLPHREEARPPHVDLLTEWPRHDFSCDPVSAGLSDQDLAFVRNSAENFHERRRRVEPYWHAARNTGYGQALALTARDVYGSGATQMLRKRTGLLWSCSSNGPGVDRSPRPPPVGFGTSRSSWINTPL